ncbi:MAG: endonuclease/exonuclease/phosphatase family metal-dependent hydrolase [Saprospiraceae bacterium]|jgi:endonuclease/exonuclease/phosphatase family metal-dependent hydrolase
MVHFVRLLIPLLAISVMSTPKANPLLLNIASFNIHYTVAKQSLDDWTPRREAVTKVINQIDADIIAFQEMETFAGGEFNDQNIQLEWILKNAPHYSPAAVGNPEEYPSTQPILYKTAILEPQQQGFFFFSKTPDTIYSEQWNGGYPYFCSWVLFEHKETNKQFYVYNVHNDYRSYRNRLKTSKLIVERVDKIKGETPVIVLGDFNEFVGLKTMNILEQSGLHIAEPTGSTNRILGFSFLPAIDHFLASDKATFKQAVKVWSGKIDGVYPSDHYPLSVQIGFE